MSFDVAAATKEGHILRSRNKDYPQICIVRRVGNATGLSVFTGNRMLTVGVIFLGRPGNRVSECYVILASRTFDRHWENVTVNAYARKIQRWWRRALQRRDAAFSIQRAWRSVIANPRHDACRRRLLREFESLDQLQ